MHVVALEGGLLWATGRPAPRAALPCRWRRMAYRDPFRSQWRGQHNELAAHLAALKVQNQTVEVLEYRYAVAIQVAEFIAGGSDGSIPRSLLEC